MDVNKVDEWDVVLADDFYFSTLCHICKKPALSLKRCSSCKLLAYCSQEHQIAHWPRHKKFCRQIKMLLTKNGHNRCHLFDVDNAKDMTVVEWKVLKIGIKNVLEELQGGELTKMQNNIWMFPRVCVICHKADQNSLFDCPSCISVSYCSKEHQQQHLAHHLKHCIQLKLFLDINLYAFNALKEVDDITPRTMDEYLKKKCFPEHRYITKSISLSAYLTLMYALKYTGLTETLKNQTRLVVHLVGASEYECALNWTEEYQVIATHMSQLKEIIFVYVGPEIPSNLGSVEDFTLSNENMKVRVSISRLLYHEYITTKKYIRPDLIAALNCGIHQFDGPFDTWSPSLKYILQTPFVMTAYTEFEANKDICKVEEQGLMLKIVNLKNEYASLRPLRSWEYESDPIYYFNNFITLVTPA